MTNSDFWNSIERIIDDGFTSEGLAKLDHYAEDFTSGRLVYKRFSSSEQYGCATGGYAHVIASIIAGAKAETDTITESISNFKRQQQRAETQAFRIESWARKVGCWFDDIDKNKTFFHETKTAVHFYMRRTAFISAFSPLFTLIIWWSREKCVTLHTDYRL